MYDSDEVRDAVRRDALDTFVQRTGAFQGFADLPPLGGLGRRGQKAAE